MICCRTAPPRLLPGLAWLVTLAAFGAVALAACGKKGPPLAPIVRVPARIETLTARRLGDIVSLQFRVPDRNQDGSSPADLGRLEVYGYTGDPGDLANFLKDGTLVATLPVRPPPEPEEETPPSEATKGKPAAPQPSRPAPAAERAAAVGFDQGAEVTVTEVLTPELIKPIVPRAAERKPAAPSRADVSPPLLGPPPGGPPGRVYLVVGYNRKGRRGPPSARVSVSVLAAPAPPQVPSLTYKEDRFVLSWTPPPTARRPIQAAGAPGLLPSSARFLEMTPASTYNVYEATRLRPVPTGGESTVPAPVLPVPLNPQPIAETMFEDLRFQFGVERCYVVRLVDTYGPNQLVESDASPMACVTPRDTFPPAAPRSLAAVASQGSISLIWEPNSESDLAGYLVLRGLAPSGPLDRITPTPIRETTYNDATARPGVRYVYVVVAVDTATPPNVSPPSNRVEETAR